MEANVSTGFGIGHGRVHIVPTLFKICPLDGIILGRVVPGAEMSGLLKDCVRMRPHCVVKWVQSFRQLHLGELLHSHWVICATSTLDHWIYNGFEITSFIMSGTWIVPIMNSLSMKHL